MIEAQIAEAANAGRFVGLTLWQTAEGCWQASLCSSRTACTVELYADPVAALTRVLRVRTAAPAPSVTEDIFG